MEKLVSDSIKLHEKLLKEFEHTGVEKIMEISNKIYDSLENNGVIYVCGNGGSAADSQHVAGELVVRLKRDRKALAAVSLTTDTSILTSIGNDYSFEDIFSRQVEALVRQEDVLWAFSTSGSSKNILKACRLAKKKGAKVVAFTGRPDCQLAKIADISLLVDSVVTASVQEIHQIAYHIVCDLVEKKYI